MMPSVHQIKLYATYFTISYFKIRNPSWSWKIGFTSPTVHFIIHFRNSSGIECGVLAPSISNIIQLLRVFLDYMIIIWSTTNSYIWIYIICLWNFRWWWRVSASPRRCQRADQVASLLALFHRVGAERFSVYSFAFLFFQSFFFEVPVGPVRRCGILR